MKRSIILLFAILLVQTSFPGSGNCASNAGSSGAQFLKVGVSARSAGLGETAAVPYGCESMFMNPAGLVHSSDVELYMSQVMWIEDISYSNVGITRRTSGSVFGFGVSYLSISPIAKYDNTGLSVGESYSPSDMALLFAYGTEFTKSLGFGTVVRYISSTIDGTTAAAYGVDLGLKNSFEGSWNEVGFVIQNIGTELKYYKKGETLPLNVKIGGKYVIPFERFGGGSLIVPHGISLLMDVNVLNELGAYGNLGVEYTKTVEGKVLLGRIGYKSNVEGLEGFNGLSIGFGIMYRIYTLDYAFAPYGDLGQSHRFSISVCW